MESFDVVIIGLGPVGLTLANLLGAKGLKVAALERETTISHMPRAGSFDGEAMRVFQMLGLAKTIEPTTGTNSSAIYYNAAREVLSRFDKRAERGTSGWQNMYMMHQPYLEEILRQNLDTYPNLTVQLGCEVLSIEQDADRATVTAKAVDSDTPFTITASYVVGCDGARSIVRRTMGVEQTDFGLHQPWLVVDLLATKPHDLPRATIHFCDPARPATQITKTKDRLRWEFMLMPGDDPAKMVEPEVYWKLLDGLCSPDMAVLERAVVYTFHSLCAKKWRDGRLLLAGDACHQMPPFFGQGLCSGVRDVTNLAWKLSSVLTDHVSDELLDSYESERLPCLEILLTELLRVGSIIQTTDPEVAAQRDAEMKAKNQPIMTPFPSLGTGIHTGSIGGTLVPQMVLADGTLSDDLFPPFSWVLIADPDLIEAAGPDMLELCRRRGIHVPAALFEPYREWLGSVNAGAIIMRPDKYAFGAANSADELRQLVLSLSEVLEPTQDKVPLVN